MANRYWVGGSGDWTDTAYWSTTSGGSGGASVPTSFDRANFDGNSGNPTVAISSGMVAQDVIFSNPATVTFSGSGDLTLGIGAASGFQGFNGTTVNMGGLVLNAKSYVFALWNGDMGTANITCGSISVGGTAGSSNATVLAAGSSVFFNNTTLGQVTLTGASVAISGALNCTTFTATSNAQAITLTNSVTATNFSFGKAGYQSSLTSSVSGTQRTITASGTVSIINATLKDLNFTNRTYVTNCVNNGNNTNVVFNNNSGALALF